SPAPASPAGFSGKPIGAPFRRRFLPTDVNGPHHPDLRPLDRPPSFHPRVPLITRPPPPPAPGLPPTPGTPPCVAHPASAAPPRGASWQCRVPVRAVPASGPFHG